MGEVRKLLQVRDAGACMELGDSGGILDVLGSRACRICCGLDVGEETGIVTTPASVCMVVSSPKGQTLRQGRGGQGRTKFCLLMWSLRNVLAAKGGCEAGSW